MSFARTVLNAVCASTAVLFCAGFSAAQTPSANASVTAVCDQSGSTMTCRTTTVYTLPSNVQLQSQTSGSGFNLTSAASGNQPNCGNLSFSPNPVTSSSQQVTLAVTCSPASGTAALQYFWNGSAAAGTAGTFVFTPFGSGATSFPASVRVCNNGLTDSANCTDRSVVINLQSSNVTAPSSCTINTSSPSAIAAGSAVSLSASCAGGSAATGYQWSKDGQVLSGQTSSTLNDVPFATGSSAQSASYTFTASNSAGTSAPSASRSFSRDVPPAGDFCNGNGVTYNTFNAANRFFTDTNGITTQTMVFPIQVQATDSSTSRPAAPWMSIVERPGGVSLAIREITISRSKCNFNNQPEFRVLSFDDYSYDHGWGVALNDTTRAASIPRLPTGLWYVNIRNQSCSGSSCDIRFTYQGLQ